MPPRDTNPPPREREPSPAPTRPARGKAPPGAVPRPAHRGATGPASRDARCAPTAPAWRNPRAIVLFVLLAAAGLAADLASKHYVFHALLADPTDREVAETYVARFTAVHGQPPPPESVLTAFRTEPVAGIRLSLSTNPGVVFGLPAHRWLVAILTVGAIVLVSVFFATSDARAHWAHVALALILAGALGNLYDRLFSVVRVPGTDPIRYQVRDFLDASDLYWPWVFNVADVFLVVGVALLMLHWARTTFRSPPAEQP